MYETDNQAPTPRTAEDEEQIDLEPEQLTLITQKTTKMPQARSASLPQLTENRETLIRKASEQAAFARTVENGQFYITDESVMDGNSCTFFNAENTQNQKFLRVRDYMQLLLIMSRSDQ